MAAFPIVLLDKIAMNKHPSKALLGHDVVEVFPGDFPAVAGGALEHFLEFLGVHGLAELLGHPADVAGVQ